MRVICRGSELDIRMSKVGDVISVIYVVNVIYANLSIKDIWFLVLQNFR